MERVVARRMPRTSCRAAKVTLVAMRRVGVGPGVKMEPQRFSKKPQTVWSKPRASRITGETRSLATISTRVAAWRIGGWRWYELSAICDEQVD